MLIQKWHNMIIDMKAFNQFSYYYFSAHKDKIWIALNYNVLECLYSHLSEKILPIGTGFWILVPQLVALFVERMESLKHMALIEELHHWS